MLLRHPLCSSRSQYSIAMENPIPLGGPPSVYDNALMGILQDCAKLPMFLDAVFSFLARRTDFYILLTAEQTKMGFPQGVAEGMVLQSFKKYEILTRKAEAERMKAEQTKKLDAMMGVPPTSTSSSASGPGKTKGKKKKKPAKVPSPEPDQPPPQDELPISLPPSTSGSDMFPHGQLPQDEVNHSAMGDDKVESSSTGEARGAGKASEGGEDGEESESEEEESEEEGEGSQGDSKKEKKPKKETATDIISDTYNGAALDNYKWSQTMTDIDVRVPVAAGTRSKDVIVEIKNDHLKVVLLKPERKVIIDEQLLHKIKVEESMWSIDSTNNNLTINLEKTKEIMWKSVLVGEKGIDLTKVDTTRDISEFDPECQAAIQRVTYDHHMKMLGKPTSSQAKAHDILKKAWNAEGSPFKGTPFDPTKVNITGDW